MVAQVFGGKSSCVNLFEWVEKYVAYKNRPCFGWDDAHEGMCAFSIIIINLFKFEIINSSYLIPEN